MDETPLTSAATDLVTIKQFGDMAEALLAKGCLESAGIFAFLADVNIARMEWPLSRGLRLQVSREDVDAATEILASAGSSTGTEAP